MSRFAILIILSSLFLVLLSTRASASLETEVQADVGEFYLNVSGYISPFASIVLNSNGIFMRTTVADKGGNFSISQVRIARGFSSFCLDAVDYKRLGESTTCIKFPPATGNVDKRELFLPPTIGLSRTVIAEGQDARVFGYSMPGAKVAVHINNEVLSTFADAAGYYEIKLSNVKAGTYLLYSTAIYKEKPSLAPSKKIELKALNWWERIIQWILEFIQKIIRWFSSIGLGILWLTIPILILILILIYKIWGGKRRKKKGYPFCPVWPYCYRKSETRSSKSLPRRQAGETEGEEMVHIG